MKTLITLLLLLSLATLAQTRIIPFSTNPTVAGGGGATPFATLDFEEGNPTDFDDSTGTILITTDAAYTGTYGLEITADATYGIKNFTARDSCYVTFYMRFEDASWSGSGSTYLAWFELTAAEKTLVMCSNAGTTVTIWRAGSSGGNQEVLTTPASIVRQSWIYVKLYFKKGATSLHGVWFDEAGAQGAALFTNGTTGVIEAAEDVQINAFHIGILSGVYPTGGSIYIDDINLYDEDPD